MRARRLAEPSEELRGVLKASTLGREGAKDAQLERSVESILARALPDQAHDGGRIDTRALLEQHRAALRPEIESPHTEGARAQLEARDPQQVLRRRRQRAEAIVQLGGELIESGITVGGGDALVERQAHVHV